MKNLVCCTKEKSIAYACSHWRCATPCHDRLRPQSRHKLLNFTINTVYVVLYRCTYRTRTVEFCWIQPFESDPGIVVIYEAVLRGKKLNLKTMWNDPIIFQILKSANFLSFHCRQHIIIKITANSCSSGKKNKHQKIWAKRFSKILYCDFRINHPTLYLKGVIYLRWVILFLMISVKCQMQPLHDLRRRWYNKTLNSTINAEKCSWVGLYGLQEGHWGLSV